MDTEEEVGAVVRTTALPDHVRDLLSAHWRDAKNSADEEGKFSIGFRVSVAVGTPAKLKVKCSISKTITDEIESQVDHSDQMKLL